MINPKTLQFLSYITKQYTQVTVTILMKLSYLIDLVSIKETKAKISDFEYERYLFGPFSRKIYDYLNELAKNKIVKEMPGYSPMGDEYIVYTFNSSAENIEFGKLSSKEKKLIDKVLGELQGLGAKALSKISYETIPMKKIGATIGNSKGLNKKIDLTT